MKIRRCITLFTAVLICSVASVSASAQDAAEGDNAIEVLHQGIPHDALYALEMSGEWGLTVGAFGLMMETTDGGGSWNLLPAVTQQSLFGIARVANKLILVGQQGIVLTREGAGEWTKVESGITERLLNVAMNESGVAVAVGAFGFAARSTDAGATWQQLTFNWDDFNDEGYEPHLYDVVVSPDGTIMLAGEFGLILRSSDNGVTFEAVNRASESIFDLYLARDGSNTGYAVGQEGLIVKTNDAGLTWQRLHANTKANLLGVWSGNGEVVIAGIREMLRSSDDGASFTNTADIKVNRTWFQGIAAGISESQAGEKGFLRQQSIFVVGHRGTIARVLK